MYDELVLTDLRDAGAEVELLPAAPSPHASCPTPALAPARTGPHAGGRRGALERTAGRGRAVTLDGPLIRPLCPGARVVRIDRHTHSTASDGRDTPAELVRNAAAAGARRDRLTTTTPPGATRRPSPRCQASTSPSSPAPNSPAASDGVGLDMLGHLFDTEEPEPPPRARGRGRDCNRVPRAQGMVVELRDLGVSDHLGAGRAHRGRRLGRLRRTSPKSLSNCVLVTASSRATPSCSMVRRRRPAPTLGKHELDPVRRDSAAPGRRRRNQLVAHLFADMSGQAAPKSVRAGSSRRLECTRSRSTATEDDDVASAAAPAARSRGRPPAPRPRAPAATTAAARSVRLGRPRVHRPRRGTASSPAAPRPAFPAPGAR